MLKKSRLRQGIDDTKINDRPIHVWRSGRERRSDRRADRAPAAFALVGACADHRRLGDVFRWLRRAGAGLYPSGAVSTLAPHAAASGVFFFPPPRPPPTRARAATP